MSSMAHPKLSSQHPSQLSMNPRPNITSYHVCMEDGGGNGGKLEGGTTKYYQFWKFGDGRFRHLDLGTTSANSCLYSWTTVAFTGAVAMHYVHCSVCRVQCAACQICYLTVETG